MSGIEIERSGAKATLWLNRPELHNAFDDGLIAELTAALAALGGGFAPSASCSWPAGARASPPAPISPG